MTKDSSPNMATWSGQKLYQCRLCSFDSLDKKRFERHFATQHPPLQVIKGGGADAMEGMTRDELNRVAVDLGIKDVEGFSTKGDVIAAVESAQKEK